MTLDALGLVGIKQTILGRGPEHGEEAGNCHQAALATVLGVQLEDVPHFLARWTADDPADDWWDRQQNWLREYHSLEMLALDADKMRYSDGRLWAPKGLHLLVGRTVRDSTHVVVGYDGEMIFDPHPSNAGLTEITYIEIFIALRPSRVAPLVAGYEMREHLAPNGKPIDGYPLQQA